MTHLYLYINLFTILFPLALSFDKKVAFYKSWGRLFRGIIIMSMIFIPWDILFTKAGIWGFNPSYLSGIYFFNLPIEECLFFLTVPFASVFIYACLEAYFPKKIKVAGKTTLTIFSIILIGFGLLYLDKSYTSFTFILCGLFILMLQHVLKVTFLPQFFRAYVIVLIPFFMVNGVLTGSFIDNEIVWYSNNHITNFRIGTIPIEDFIYNLLMLLLTITVYEKSRKTIE